MSDPLDIAMGAGGGATVAGMLVALLRFAGSRNISALDDTLKSLRASTDILSKDVRDLREANIGLAKDIGALSGRIDAHEKELVRMKWKHLNPPGPKGGKGASPNRAGSAAAL